MTDLEKFVNKSISVFRSLYPFIAVAVGFAFASMQENPISFLFIICFLASSITFYYVGLFSIALIVHLIFDEEQLSHDIRVLEARKINEEIQNGSLVPGRELDERLAAAGLNVITLEEFGPIIGQQGEVTLYDWVIAKETKTNSSRKYFFNGTADFDADGNIISEDMSLNIVIDGNLYSCKINEEEIQEIANSFRT